MPLLLRKVRQNRWFKNDARPWLEQGDVPADPLGDLKTSQHELSVWEVANDRSNLERIVRALAVNGTHKIDSTGYVLFESSLLSDAGIGEPRANEGKTPDAGANVWHRDLVNLSGNKLVALTKLILERGESGTVLGRRLRDLVSQGIQLHELPASLSKLL